MKKWENPKKILPVLGFLPTAVLAVCIAVSLGDYTAPVLSLDAAGSETGTQTGTLTTGKAKGTKNCCGNDKSTGSGSHTGFGIRYLSGRHLYRYRHRIFRTDHGAGGYRGRKDQGYYRCQLHRRFSLSAKCFGTAQADRCPAKHKRGYRFRCNL